MKQYFFIPPLGAAAYSALVISLVAFGIGIAALSISLVCLLGVTHG